MNSNIEELITALYDMIQDAKALPLGADKCIIERDRALDMLDEISAQMPGEFKQARTIVQSREELVSQARREAETIIRNAREEADRLVSQEAISVEARRRCEEQVRQTQAQIEQLKKVSNDYIANSLQQAEDTIQRTLYEVQGVRSKFQTVTSEAAPSPAAPANPSFDQELD